MLYNILALVGGLVGGAVVALTVIAPRTATKMDDRALDLLVQVKKALEALGSPGQAPK